MVDLSIAMLVHQRVIFIGTSHHNDVNRLVKGILVWLKCFVFNVAVEFPVGSGGLVVSKKGCLFLVPHGVAWW